MYRLVPDEDGEQPHQVSLSYGRCQAEEAGQSRGDELTDQGVQRRVESMKTEEVR